MVSLLWEFQKQPPLPGRELLVVYPHAGIMHELSIAVSLIDMATEEAERLGVRVEALHLRLGALSGVVREALLFSFELAAEGTAVEGARLEIEEVPVMVFCPVCREERALPSLQNFRCPVCGAPTPEVVRGRELELATMEVSALEEEKNATADR
jgi:hydrogenase nickel incorporation protein HypA/HybF